MLFRNRHCGSCKVENTITEACSFKNSRIDDDDVHHRYKARDSSQRFIPVAGVVSLEGEIVFHLRCVLAIFDVRRLLQTTWSTVNVRETLRA